VPEQNFYLPEGHRLFISDYFSRKLFSRKSSSLSSLQKVHTQLSRMSLKCEQTIYIPAICLPISCSCLIYN